MEKSSDINNYLLKGFYFLDFLFIFELILKLCIDKKVWIINNWKITWIEFFLSLTKKRIQRINPNYYIQILSRQS